jgi:hypothetical protein
MLKRAIERRESNRTGETKEEGEQEEKMADVV